MTPKVVKIAYIVAIVVLALAFLAYLLTALVSGEPLFLVPVLIGGPFITWLYLIFIRMTLEFFVAIVRMSEDVHQRLPRT